VGLQRAGGFSLDRPCRAISLGNHHGRTVIRKGSPASRPRPMGKRQSLRCNQGELSPTHANRAPILQHAAATTRLSGNLFHSVTARSATGTECEMRMRSSANGYNTTPSSTRNPAPSANGSIKPWQNGGSAGVTGPKTMSRLPPLDRLGYQLTGAPGSSLYEGARSIRRCGNPKQQDTGDLDTKCTCLNAFSPRLTGCTVSLRTKTDL
jgi:hypothetical protein